MDAASTCFRSESDFCSDCGSVLPPPGVQDTVTCLNCGLRTQVTEFQGKYVQRSIVFNKLDTIALSDESDDTGALKGPLIDRRCSRCGCEKMVYHTRQMRSADEGQTVFYTCVQCRNVGTYEHGTNKDVFSCICASIAEKNEHGTPINCQEHMQQFPGERRFLMQ